MTRTRTIPARWRYSLGSDHVGYVPRDSLEDYAGKSLYNALARLRDSWTPATCWAQFSTEGSNATLVMLAGYTGDYGQIKKLDEPYPFSITVPPGVSRSQVLGTDEAQEELGRSLGRKAQLDIPVTLSIAEADPNRPRGGGPVILVAREGVAIGALSAKNSAPVIPVVEYLEAHGREAVALAWVRPSSGARGGLVCSVLARGALSAQPAAAGATVPAAWHPDPSGRHELRYWDGTAWTSHVFDNGVQSVDPL